MIEMKYKFDNRLIFYINNVENSKNNLKGKKKWE